MNQAILLCLFALICVSFAQTTTIQFALMMQGSCNGSACTAKGNSQTITTSISATDAVSFNVNNIIGTFATLNFMNPKAPQFRAGSTYASMSFGTHLARNHTLEMVNAPGGIVMPGENDDTIIASGAFVVVGGMGAFDGAYGAISYTASLNTDDNTVTAFVYGRPYIPDSSRREAAMAVVKEILAK